MHSSTLLNILSIAAVARSACTGPQVNQATVDLVASFEGFRASVYTDATGHPTIGYGHLCQQRDCKEVHYPKPLSEADGKKLFSQDLGVSAYVVKFCISSLKKKQSAQQCITLATGNPVKLNANQYGALVSWAFNVGCGNVKSSSLIARLNKGEDPKAVIARELPQWNKGGGKPIAGLTRRRQAEVALANQPTSQGALPVIC